MCTEYTTTELLDMVDGFKDSKENENEHEYSEEEFYDIEKFGTAYTFDESESYYNSLKEKFSEVLTTLTDRETRIVKLCYGLDGNDPMSAPQVGKLFGLSGDRIRQILYRALRKLRHPNRANRIRAFYEDDPENEEYTRLNY